jgi:carbamoyl-phosphate synthase large subunit
VGLNGPLDIDIRRKGDGIPVVLEINARFGANIRYAPEILDAVIRQLESN